MRLLVAFLGLLVAGCGLAATPSAGPAGSLAANQRSIPTPSAELSPPAPEEALPAWHADEVPHTEHWASVIVVLDLADGTDPSTARDLRRAVVELMVNATDGTEIGVVRADESAQTIVEPVAMGTGRADAIERVWSAPIVGERNLAAGLAAASAVLEQMEANASHSGILLMASR